MANGNILHFVGARLRVNGSGLLRLTMKSADDINTDVMPNITMQASTNTEPLSLANFTDQRGRLRIEVTGFDESFSISRIILYAKEVGTGWPQ